MILKSIKTEQTDERTGLVVKRIITSEWENLNRKVAVSQTDTRKDEEIGQSCVLFFILTNIISYV